MAGVTVRMDRSGKPNLGGPVLEFSRGLSPKYCCVCEGSFPGAETGNLTASSLRDLLIRDAEGTLRFIMENSKITVLP